MNKNDKNFRGPSKATPVQSAFDDTFHDMIDELPTMRSSIGCVIPAYNEADTIGEVLDSLLSQTRLPDVIHVVVNNTTDNTAKVASHFAGSHSRTWDGVTQNTQIFVHDIGRNPDKKVGALNYGFSLVEACDYMLGVDGDTTAQPNAIELLEAEIASDSRIGGISAIYTIDDAKRSGPLENFLISGQRAQFAAFNMQNMLRGRNMAVLGGQYSIFSIKALREVMAENRQNSPWVRDSEVEDSLLSLQIKNAGFLTKISATSRAFVGGMTSLRGLDAQQVKWNAGAIELMWPGQRGDTKGMPFHPNLRLRWTENVSMLVNVITRLLFVLLLAGALSNKTFVFAPIWLIPPFVATVLNIKTAMSMKARSWRDLGYAYSVFLPEIYMWVRMGHFVRAWGRFFRNSQTDSWAEQAKAEGGSGNAFLSPLVGTVVFFAALALLWTQLSLKTQTLILDIGWPILGWTAAVQTLFMLRRVLKSHRGFRV
jgi:glycosyltransferase involved in cell wall biosynthesis